MDQTEPQFRCPRCQATNVRRSRPRWHERVAGWFFDDTPCRCRVCRWRGWASAFVAESPTAQKSVVAGASRLRLNGYVSGVAIAGTLLAVLAGWQFTSSNGEARARTTYRFAENGAAHPASQATPLALIDSRVERSAAGDFWYVEGEVQNVSEQRLVNIQVVTTWFNRGQERIRTEGGLIDLQQLMPGQTSRFHTLTKYHPAITSVKIAFESDLGAPLSVRDDAARSAVQMLPGTTP